MSSPSHLDLLCASLLERARGVNVANYEFLVAVRRCDEGKAWGAFATCSEWLAKKLGLSRVTAREKLRVARGLRRLPLIEAAFAKGELSYTKVRVLIRFAAPERESELLQLAQEVTGAELLRRLRPAARAPLLHSRLRWRSRAGRSQLEVACNPRAERLLRAALAVARGEVPSGGCLAQQGAEALMQICVAYLTDRKPAASRLSSRSAYARSDSPSALARGATLRVDPESESGEGLIIDLEPRRVQLRILPPSEDADERGAGWLRAG